KSRKTSAALPEERGESRRAIGEIEAAVRRRINFEESTYGKRGSTSQRTTEGDRSPATNGQRRFTDCRSSAGSRRREATYEVGSHPQRLAAQNHIVYTLQWRRRLVA